jgi:hypothetical protein
VQPSCGALLGERDMPEDELSNQPAIADRCSRLATHQAEA